jgi:hypothetical protein
MRRSGVRSRSPSPSRGGGAWDAHTHIRGHPMMPMHLPPSPLHPPHPHGRVPIPFLPPPQFGWPPLPVMGVIPPPPPIPQPGGSSRDAVFDRDRDRHPRRDEIERDGWDRDRELQREAQQHQRHTAPANVQHTPVRPRHHSRERDPRYAPTSATAPVTPILGSRGDGVHRETATPHSASRHHSSPHISSVHASTSNRRDEYSSSLAYGQPPPSKQREHISAEVDQWERERERVHVSSQRSHSPHGSSRKRNRSRSRSLSPEAYKLGKYSGPVQDRERSSEKKKFTAFPQQDTRSQHTTTAGASSRASSAASSHAPQLERHDYAPQRAHTEKQQMSRNSNASVQSQSDQRERETPREQHSSATPRPKQPQSQSQQPAFSERDEQLPRSESSMSAYGDVLPPTRAPPFQRSVTEQSHQRQHRQNSHTQPPSHSPQPHVDDSPPTAAPSLSRAPTMPTTPSVAQTNAQRTPMQVNGRSNTNSIAASVKPVTPAFARSQSLQITPSTPCSAPSAAGAASSSTVPSASPSMVSVSSVSNISRTSAEASVLPGLLDKFILTPIRQSMDKFPSVPPITTQLQSIPPAERPVMLALAAQRQANMDALKAEFQLMHTEMDISIACAEVARIRAFAAAGNVTAPLDASARTATVTH